jgi:alpha-galactosidase
MIPSHQEQEKARQWAGLFEAAGEEFSPPFSFVYDGRESGELMPGWARESRTSELSDDVTRQTVTYTDPATGLAVRGEINVHHDFPAVEWVLHFHNTGSSDTPVIENIQALEARLPLGAGQKCLIRYANGSLCSVDDFAPRERELRPRGQLRLQPGGGRSSSEVLPFCNVETGAEGAMLAIGWTGEWAAEFTRDEEGSVRLQAGLARTHLKLHPGEEIRTPRILMLFWQEDRWRGHNLLRRFILKHHCPRRDGEPLMGPLCNGNWGGTSAAVHLDNVEKIIQHDLPFEYYWIDAEWFGGAGHWMEHAGNWQPREDLYPEGFSPISERLHACGRGLLLWFEPERVAPHTPWAQEHEDWLLEVPPERAIRWADYGEYLAPSEWVRMESQRNQLGSGDKLFNLGNPEARRFLTDFLSDTITAFGLDCLRQDSNIAHLEYWRHADAPDRQGITEIRYVEGQYALWDELLERHPHLIIDNCASGGRRIDLESIGRTTPLWRTDYTVGHRDPTPIQCHTYGLLSWIPLNGTGGGGYLKDWDAYTLRSTMSATLVVGLWGHGDARQETIPEDYPFAHAKDLLEQYLRIRPYFYGDYYPLTEYSLAEDAWMAYQLDRPEFGDGLVVVLKRSRSPFTQAVFRLHGLRPDADYQVTNLDTQATAVVSGEELREQGWAIELLKNPDSTLIQYISTARCKG